jgi:hypothetical protein
VYLLTLAAIFSCAAAPQTAVPAAPEPSAPPPAWVTDLESVYPRAAFIATAGKGSTREQAEMNALAALARFLESEVKANTKSTERLVDSSGAVTEERQMDTAVFVESQMKLSFVRYADPPWYNPQEQAWQTVASIDRDEAWALYEPDLSRMASVFLSFYDRTAVEEDWLTITMLLQQAALYAGRDEFVNTEAFGQLVAPARMNALFAEVREKRAALPQALAEARRGAVVYIDCPLDNDGVLAAVVTRSLASLGFTSTTRANTTRAVCRVEVTEGYKKTAEASFYYPSAAVTLASGETSLLSFAVTTARQAAVTEDVAKRRAYNALAQVLEERFVDEYNAALKINLETGVK